MSHSPLVEAQAQLGQAIALHKKGQLGQAKVIYEDILKIQPEHASALHLLGVIAIQERNYQSAVELIGKAIEISPNTAMFQSLTTALRCRGSNGLTPSNT